MVMINYANSARRPDDMRETYASSATMNQRTSILDPHLSVLQLLERNDSDGGPTQEGDSSQMGLELQSALHTAPSPQHLYSEALNRSISDSWQSIKRTDYSILNMFGEPPAQPAGILSSSDTSEDEPDHLGSPSPNNFAFQNSALHYSHRPVEGPSVSYSGVIDENDNETVTISLGNSSNSFVMPKLSLSQKFQKFCILIVGKPARKFYQTIPRMYQKLFEVGDLDRLEDEKVSHYSAIMVIFNDVRSAPNLMEKVMDYDKAVVAVCQRGQQQQISHMLQKTARAKSLRIIYHLTVMSDHQDVHKMLKYLHSLSTEVDSGYETEVASSKVRKRKKSHKKKDSGLSRWVLWSISLTVGVGIGYCISCVLSSTMGTPATVSLHSTDEYKLIEDVPNTSSENAFDHYLNHAVYLFRKAIKQVNQAIKQMLNSQVSSMAWMQRMGKEWISEDSDRPVAGMAALDLVLI
ncbi:LAFE_0F00914g1_1 [Lachancea fermentati]|uniref:LAFE_0F00914g1_1 n=1 Tax=Lachancea fermentati TaxID=4955 RepID=A0A1G4MEL1_LACFM|nr:LAFE_0F00914g1_1 [Lachancea fermentati]